MGRGKRIEHNVCWARARVYICMCIYINVFRLFKNSGHSRRSVSNLAWNNTISERQPCARVLNTSPCGLPSPDRASYTPWSKSRSFGENDNDGSGRLVPPPPPPSEGFSTFIYIYMYVYIYTKDFAIITNTIIFWICSGRVFRAKSALIILRVGGEKLLNSIQRSNFIYICFIIWSTLKKCIYISERLIGTLLFSKWLFHLIHQYRNDVINNCRSFSLLLREIHDTWFQDYTVNIICYNKVATSFRDV